MSQIWLDKLEVWIPSTSAYTAEDESSTTSPKKIILHKNICKGWVSFSAKIKTHDLGAVLY